MYTYYFDETMIAALNFEADVSVFWGEISANSSNGLFINLCGSICNAQIIFLIDIYIYIGE